MTRDRRRRVVAAALCLGAALLLVCVAVAGGSGLHAPPGVVYLGALAFAEAGVALLGVGTAVLCVIVWLMLRGLVVRQPESTRLPRPEARATAGDQACGVIVECAR